MRWISVIAPRKGSKEFKDPSEQDREMLKQHAHAQQLGYTNAFLEDSGGAPFKRKLKAIKSDEEEPPEKSAKKAAASRAKVRQQLAQDVPKNYGVVQRGLVTLKADAAKSLRAGENALGAGMVPMMEAACGRLSWSGDVPNHAMDA